MTSWHSLLACPHCQQVLTFMEEAAHCSTCETHFPVRNGVVHVAALPLLEETEDAQAMVRGYRKPNRWLSAARRVVSSEFFPGKRWKQIKAGLFQPGNHCLVIGSGITRYDHAIHLDLDDFPNVDVVSDAQVLPFQTGSVDAVLCEVVLEHVENAGQVIDETFRVLKPGGRCLFITPFLFPFHGHPADYRRWTRQGLKAEFAAFEQVETGIHAGPCSAMINLTTELAYVLSGLRFPHGYTIVKGAFTALLFWLKYLDALVIRFPEAHRLASTLYVTATKPDDA